MSVQKLLNRLAFVNRMTIPNQDNGSWNKMKNLLKKGNHLFACQAMPIRADAQSEPLALWRNQEHTQQTEAFVMVNRGSQNRCLTSARPAPLNRRYECKAAFVFQSEGSAQLPTLFLSLVILRLSTVRWLHYHDAEVGAEAADCSSPSVALHAKPHSHGNELQITARSLGLFDPASNSSLGTQRHKHLYLKPFPNVSTASRKACSDVPVIELPFSSLAFSFPAASGPRNVV